MLIRENNRLFSQVSTNQRVIVPGKNMSVCKSRVAPGYPGSVAVQLSGGWFYQLGTTQNFQSLRGKLSN